MNWDLGKLYAGFDDPALARDAEDARNKITSASAAVAALALPADAKALSAVGEDLQLLDVLGRPAAHLGVGPAGVVANHAADRAVVVGGRVRAEGQAVAARRPV